MDNSKFKYYTSKATPLLKALAVFFSGEGRIINRKLENQNELSGFSSFELENGIDQLLKMEVLREIDEPSELIDTSGDESSIAELKMDSRFGTELLWLKQFRTDSAGALKELQGLKVLIIGAGGLGSSLAVKLSALGVKEISVMDGDIVELDNLTRQIYYTPKQAKSKWLKVDALGKFIKNFYPETEYVGIPKFIEGQEDLDSFAVNDFDLILQTADYPRGLIDDWTNYFALTYHIPTIFTHHKTVGPFFVPGQTSCFKCFENQINRDTKGLFFEYKALAKNKPNSKSPSYAGGLILNEAVILDMIVKYFVLHNINSYKNKVWRIKSEKIEFEVYEYQRNKTCECDKGR